MYAVCVQMSVTATTASIIVSNVVNIIGNISGEEQGEGNFDIIANIYSDIGDLVENGEIDATSNVSDQLYLTTNTANIDFAITLYSLLFNHKIILH